VGIQQAQGATYGSEAGHLQEFPTKFCHTPPTLPFQLYGSVRHATEIRWSFDNVPSV